MVGVVSFTLYQCLKFVYDLQEVLIHGERGQESLDTMELFRSTKVSCCGRVKVKEYFLDLHIN